MNQIAMIAHTYSYIDEEFYYEQVKRINKLIKELKSKYLDMGKE